MQLCDLPETLLEPAARAVFGDGGVHRAVTAFLAIGRPLPLGHPSAIDSDAGATRPIGICSWFVPFAFMAMPVSGWLPEEGPARVACEGAVVKTRSGVLATHHTLTNVTVLHPQTASGEVEANLKSEENFLVALTVFTEPV